MCVVDMKMMKRSTGKNQKYVGTVYLRLGFKLHGVPQGSVLGPNTST